MQSKKASAGFSILELSIVVMIIGVLVGGVMMAGSSQIEAAKESQTRKKMAVIEEALLTFRRVNGRLPCPNLLYHASSNSNYGWETDNAGYGIGGCDGVYALPNGARYGTVPVKTLNLPIDFMYDGWGRKFQYIVSRNYTYYNAFKTYPLSSSTSGTVGIRDQNDNVITDYAVYTLISAGKNGHAGYLPTGGWVNANSTNAMELVNCKCSGNSNYFYAARFINNATPTLRYDDITAYKTRMQLTGYDE